MRNLLDVLPHRRAGDLLHGSPFALRLRAQGLGLLVGEPQSHRHDAMTPE
jgi:hypothetical protein